MTGESCRCFLAGDLNSEAVEEAYRILSAEGSSVVDLRGEVKVEDRYGNENTYTGFAGEEKAKRIDFLYVERKSKRASN